MKHLKTLALAAFVLLAPLASFAAVDHAIVTSTDRSDTPGHLLVNVLYQDGPTQVATTSLDIGVANYVLEGDYYNSSYFNAMKDAVNLDAFFRGYSLSGDPVFPWMSFLQTQAVLETTIASSTYQPDWNQADTTKHSYIKNKPVVPVVNAKVYSSPTITLGTVFQPSATRSADVRASFRIANVLTLSGGAAGDIILEQADNSGMSTNVVELGRCGNGNTGGLVVGLTLNDAIACQVTGDIQAGKYARFRSATTVGTPTYTVLSARQVLQASN